MLWIVLLLILLLLTWIFLSPLHSNKGLGAAFEKVPDLVEKFMDKKRQKKEDMVDTK